MKRQMPARAWNVARALKKRFRQTTSRGPESGQSLIIVILSLFVLLGICAFVIDVANLELARHRAQNAADAGALAAAGEMENASNSSGTVIAEGKSIGSANDPPGSVTITQPEGPTGEQAKATVTQNLNLPFANVFGLGNGSVTASAVAQDDSNFCTDDTAKCIQNKTYVADGNINAQGCPAATESGVCEYYANDCDVYGCPDGPSGYPTDVIGAAGGWTVTPSAEDPDTLPANTQGYPDFYWNDGSSSADLQDCTGATFHGTCGGTGVDCNITNSTLVVDLNGNTEGGMWQTVPTVTGATYKLSFCVTANPNGYVQDAQTAFNDYSTFTGDLQITDNGQYTPNCPAIAGPTTADINAGIKDTASTSCECPTTNVPSYVLACQPISVTNQWPSGASGAEQATFEEEQLTFTAQSSETTITFNSSTWGNDQVPWIFYGPEVASLSLEYPADALVQ